MFFVIERTIDGSNINFVERFNNDHFTDASVRITSGLPSDSFNGLDHLEGETCKIIADDSILDDEMINSGSVTIDRDAESLLEVGINYTPIVKDLPASVEIGAESSLTGRKTNISEVVVRMKDTASLTINGKNVSFKTFGPSGEGSPLDQTPQRFTGVKRLMGFRGWTEDAQVTISQNDPLPMTILSLKKRVNT